MVKWGMAEANQVANKPIGRPTLLTPELKSKLVLYISQGNYANVACAAVGISTDALGYWRERAGRGEEPYYGLFQALKKAEAEAEVKIVADVTNQAPKNWVAGITYLERRHPSRWGRHDRVDHELSQQGMELLQRLREIGERPAVEGPVIEGPVIEGEVKEIGET